MDPPIEYRAIEILNELASDQHLEQFVDARYDIPKVFIGSGEIKLVILGQDPTVKNPKSRAKIKTVLNLDRNNSLRRYLDEVCTGLGIDLNENVYATNLFKNFFIDPPTQIKEINIFQACLPYWLPLLKEELALYPEVPIISLGQPLLETIVSGNASAMVRDYWGYTKEWKAGITGPFKYLHAEDNNIGRIVFPYPHQPSIRKDFYRERLTQYSKYMRLNTNL